MLERGWQLLGRPRAWVALLGLAVLLALPALSLGFHADDWLFFGVLDGVLPSRGSTFDLYHFASGDAARNAEQISQGLMPWWSHPELKMHFLRPLACGLIALDHRVLGLSPLGYHVHTLLWYLGFVAAVGYFLRGVLPSAMAGLALLVFVLDGSHAESVMWLANRHMAMAGVPAFLALGYYVRARAAQPWRSSVVLALGVALGLAAGESALGVACYAFAYELWRGPLREGARRLVPLLAVLALYFAAYKALGYGAAHSAEYVEPFSDPVGFLAALSWRVPALLGEFLIGLPVFLTIVTSPWPFALVGVLAVVTTALLVRAFSSLVPEGERQALAWLVVGALACLVPLAGALPTSRLLLFPSVGGSVLVAYVLRYGWQRLSAGGVVLAVRRLGFVVVAVVHLVLAPLALVSKPPMFGRLAAQLDVLATRVPFGVEPGQRVVMLAAADPMVGLYLGLVRGVKEPSSIKSWTALSLGKHRHTFAREGERVIVVRTERTFLSGTFERLFRAPGTPFAVGQQVKVSSGTVTVREVHRGIPTVFALELDVPLDDPSVVLLAWRQHDLVRIDLPRSGAPVVVPWSLGPMGLL